MQQLRPYEARNTADGCVCGEVAASKKWWSTQFAGSVVAANKLHARGLPSPIARVHEQRRLFSKL
ncbi:hypothetical protein HPP92_021584 [Vanilla planifolia]|uniref:Uncharacterized protein n=1 Tax=Vanilla planifolia TaxID=51239 RepID=A0A835UGY8_VANPL|nr:hypothetical protein HPP92_021584 [Vanilla planifolia]